jgi:hypothetical protein
MWPQTKTTWLTIVRFLLLIGLILYNLILDADPGVPAVDVDMDDDIKEVDTPTTILLPSLVSPLIALIYPTSLSFPPLAAPSPHPPTTSALSAIHVSALECLNNIFLSLSTSPNPSIIANSVGGLKIWNDIWSALALVGTDDGLGQERRQEIWEVAVGVLWGVGSIWKGTLVCRCSPCLVYSLTILMQIPNADQINILTHICDVASDPRIQVKCIGTLECLAQHPNSIETNKVSISTLVYMPNLSASTTRLFPITCSQCSLCNRPHLLLAQNHLYSRSPLSLTYTLMRTCHTTSIFKKGDTSLGFRLVWMV